MIHIKVLSKGGGECIEPCTHVWFGTGTLKTAVRRYVLRRQQELATPAYLTATALGYVLTTKAAIGI